MTTTRSETLVEDGTIYIEDDDGTVEVGPIDDVLDHYGETYESDNGIRRDVVETVEAMTHSSQAVSWVKSKSLSLKDQYDNPEEGAFSTGRMALFMGFLSESLENGPM